MKRARRASKDPDERGPDVNALVTALLGDLASIQTDRQKQWGYKGAAAAIARLDRPLSELVQPDGTLPKIPRVGPSSERVIREVLATGASETLERAVLSSGRAADIEKRRTLRVGFLSRAEALRILAAPMAGVVRREDYLGDLQMHSRWSDGAVTIAELAEGGLARGYRYLAVTDHSLGLQIARGMSLEAMATQRREIDALNRRLGDRFRVIKGIEANILPDGALDVPPDELRAIEIVLAAPHSKLRSPDDQTARLLRAITTPHVHVLAHPRGRVAGTRAGIQADWDQIFEVAAAHHVAIELDGDPARQDLDATLASSALSVGCVFALDSDAHDVDELAYADTALAHARLAGIPAERVINCWEVGRLIEWLSRD
jgi:histidinol phosphatase-like PHP family hydrolase